MSKPFGRTTEQQGSSGCACAVAAFMRDMWARGEARLAVVRLVFRNDVAEPILRSRKSA